LYHSTFGATADGILKPELIAQAIWVAAPILPGTSEKKEAEWLHRLLKLSGAEWHEFIALHQANLREETKLNVDLLFDINVARQNIIDRIQATKFFSPSYMHVDGTSFAAPIVSSIIAQLLQHHPQLTPKEVRTLLFETAQRLFNFEASRQGFGMVNPRKAITQLMKSEQHPSILRSPTINSAKGIIEFYIRHPGAYQISLVGDFNNWTRDVLFLIPGKGGIWKIELPMLPEGTYRYKFLVDEHHWLEDVSNPLREPDNYNGFNSVLHVRHEERQSALAVL
jgi:serine protease AprX